MSDLKVVRPSPVDVITAIASLELSVMQAASMNRPLPPLAVAVHALLFGKRFRGRRVHQLRVEPPVGVDERNGGAVYSMCTFVSPTTGEELIAVTHFGGCVTLRSIAFDHRNDAVADAAFPIRKQWNGVPSASGICQLWDQPTLLVGVERKSLMRLHLRDDTTSSCNNRFTPGDTLQLVALVPLADKKTVVASDYGRGLVLIDVTTETVTRTLVQGDVCSVALSPCGHRVAFTRYIQQTVDVIPIDGTDASQVNGELPKPTTIACEPWTAGVLWLREGVLFGCAVDAPLTLVDNAAIENGAPDTASERKLDGHHGSTFAMCQTRQGLVLCLPIYWWVSGTATVFD